MDVFEQARTAGFKLIKREQINDQVLNGLKFTASYYDQKLQKV